MHTHEHTQVRAGIHTQTQKRWRRGNSKGGTEDEEDEEDAGEV